MTALPVVMVVDDSPTDGDFIQAALKAAEIPAALVRFRRGEEVLARMEAWRADETAPPDLVILDWKMPGIGGAETLTGLREKYGPGTLPVVVFTSSREPSDIARAYRAGANSYVVKPVIFEEYSSAIAEVVRYWLGVNSPDREPGGEDG